MKITIEYESSWRNSFLNGNNNEPLPPQKKRDFVGSMWSLKTKGNFMVREITLDTVMGILNRLIGDQRKLYQSRNKEFLDSYYFEELEQKISFNDNPTLSNEVVYIRNMKGSTDQNSFTGMVKTDDPMFRSDYSREFWGVLALDFDEICDFIINEKLPEKEFLLNPLAISAVFEGLGKAKPVELQGQPEAAVSLLSDVFPDVAYLNNKGMLPPIALYCSALYLQLERLSDTYDMSSAKTKAGCISGVSKKGFTKKNFMERFTTGKGKTIWGNPYIKKERIKGQGEVTSMLTKASGQLEIVIDVDKEKGREIQSMIECAGVSSFYLGKKGLAYVSKLRA